MDVGDRLRWTARATTRFARAAGLDLTTALQFPADLWRYGRDVRDFRRALRARGGGAELHLYPILGEWRELAGHTRGHYFQQDLWAARRIIGRRPEQHVDVGSRIDGFVAHLLAAGLPVTVVDIRSMPEPIEGMRFVREDALRLSSFTDGSIESLSCLHAIEHFGLGRYGDELDPDAHVNVCQTFSRKLQPGGHLLISAPIGRPRIEFNAHRVFHPTDLPDLFEGLTLAAFASISDRGTLRTDAAPRDLVDAHYGLGMYEFRRP